MRGDLGSESSIGDREDSTEMKFARPPSATLQFVAELQPPLFLLSSATSIVVETGAPSRMPNLHLRCEGRTVILKNIKNIYLSLNLFECLKY